MDWDDPLKPEMNKEENGHLLGATTCHVQLDTACASWKWYVNGTLSKRSEPAMADMDTLEGSCANQIWRRENTEEVEEH